MKAIALLKKHGSGNTPNGITSFAMSAAKCAEIMNADKRPSGFLHRGYIQRSVDTNRCPPDERVSLAGIEDAVPVGPPAGVSSRIPIKRDIGDRSDREIGGKVIIDCPVQGFGS